MARSEAGNAGFSGPKRSLGQNFLQDQNTARRIIQALGPAPGDRVLEIGPGQGALTRWLLEAGCVTAALEKDRELAPQLKQRWPELAVANADALQFCWEGLDVAPGRWKLVGNLPYNVASPMLWDICSRSRRFQRAVFMVQKEVGQRLTAGPGSKIYGALSVWVQSFCHVRKEFVVGPQVFRPRPKVDSMVVSLEPLEKMSVHFSPAALSLLLKGCFSKRRKQLANILKGCWSLEVEMVLRDAGLNAADRPENVAPQTFQTLSLHCEKCFPS